MVKKHGFWYFVKYYNLLIYLAFAIVLYLVKDYVFLLFCQLTQVTSERSIFYKINELLVKAGAGEKKIDYTQYVEDAMKKAMKNPFNRKSDLSKRR